jgi:peptidoglycan/xylan/chitin deacetylase (PgdA/CDA1 family)
MSKPARVHILIFHGIGEPTRAFEPGEDKVWVSLADFRSVLDVVAERDDVVVSFDDGNASDHALALPELAARGLRATFFIVADRIDRPAFLSVGAIHELLEAGMSVQSHGMRHRVWRGLDGAAMREELVSARAIIEDVIGRAVDEVAIPYCLYDRRVLAALRDADYRHVFTCDRGPAKASAWLQARNQISAGEDGRKVAEITSPPVITRVEIAAKKAIKRRR